MATTTAAAKMEAALAEARKFTLPPFDAGAKHPRDIYPLRGIIGKEAAKGLDATALPRILAAVREAASSDTGKSTGDVVYEFSRGAGDYFRSRLHHLVSRLAAGEDDGAPAWADYKRHAASASASGDDDSYPADAPRPTKAGTLLRRRLRALLYLRALVELHNGPRTFGYTIISSGPKPAAAAAATTDAAAAGGGDAGADAEMAAALGIDAAGDSSSSSAAAVGGAGTGEPAAKPSHRVGVQHLKFQARGVAACALETFTETRGDDTPKALTGKLAEVAAEAGGLSVPSKTHTITPPLNDRLQSYIAALALHVDDFAPVDIGPLARDMKVTPQRLMTVCREMGCVCKPVKGESHAAGAPEKAADEGDENEEAGGAAGKSTGATVSYTVELKAPLTFPKMKLMRKK